MDSAAGQRLVIASYDPGWPAAFEHERQLIMGAIGARLVAIEHIGSTAVPGLGAKPIIDILAGLPRLLDADACMLPLATLGYQFVPEAVRYLPDDRYFRRWSGATPELSDELAHLHLTEFGATFWLERVRFRDLLRSTPTVAAAYERLKRELAPRYMSGAEYSEAKTDFIRSALAATLRP
jgi:GrpB-like predicted nucleotidyltransferase (UPF0157 family)